MPIGIPPHSNNPFLFTDTDRHFYGIGKTGTGKTTLLKNMAAHQILNGEGVGLLDFHGDISYDLVRYIPQSRRDDLIYLSPDTPVGLNPLYKIPEAERATTIEKIIDTFVTIFGDQAFGIRTQQITRHTLHILMQHNLSLADFNSVTFNEEYRDQLLKTVKNPDTHFYWRTIFKGYGKQEQQNVRSPATNKLDALLGHDFLRECLCAPSRLDYRKMLDTGRIFIARIPKGAIGTHPAQFLATILTTAITQAAFSREDVEEERRPQLPLFNLYIDEFQNAAAADIETILSESRKYRLALNIFHQYIYQLSESVQAAIFGNVGTTLAFRVGPRDAKVLAELFDITRPQAFTELENHHVKLVALQRGVPTSALTLETLPPLPYPQQSRNRPLSRKQYINRLIAHAHRRYGLSRGRLAVQQASC